MEHQIKEFDSLIDLLEDLDREGIYGQLRKEAMNSFISARARVTGRPIVASFELTPLCNFDCKMCYVHLNRQQMNGCELLAVDEWKRIIDMSVAAGIMYADITGGECLTYPGFREVYLHLWQCGIRPSVLTNGSLLTDEIIGLFSEYPPHLVQVTVYGSNSAAYQKVTGVDAFSAVMEGIHKLKVAGVPYKITITPNRYMMDDADDLLQLVRDMRVEYGIAGVTLEARPETGRSSEEFRLDAELFVRLHKADIEYRKAHGAFRTLDNKYEFLVKGNKGLPGVPCSAGRGTFHVNWKGEMTPCISFHSVKSSMLDNGFDAAWNTIHSAMVRYEDPKECVNCDKREVCTSCPAEKCSGVPGMSLNVSVCKRLDEYIQNGLHGEASGIECTE